MGLCAFLTCPTAPLAPPSGLLVYTTFLAPLPSSPHPSKAFWEISRRALLPALVPSQSSALDRRSGQDVPVYGAELGVGRAVGAPRGAGARWSHGGTPVWG